VGRSGTKGPPRATRHVLLLAGGAGSRMGGGKPFVAVDGRPLWQVTASRLEDLGCTVVVSTGSHEFPVGPFPLVPDRVPDRGPLEGLAAAHASDPARDWLVWPCDVPEPVAEDIDALVVTDDRVRCLADATGRAQPLMARWPSGILADLDRYLDGGGRSVLGFLDGHPPRLLGRRDRRHLTTRADLEEWKGGSR
jgi:molybdenum cofactor guanylyltransferase